MVTYPDSPPPSLPEPDSGFPQHDAEIRSGEYVRGPSVKVKEVHIEVHEMPAAEAGGVEEDIFCLVRELRAAFFDHRTPPHRRVLLAQAGHDHVCDRGRSAVIDEAPAELCEFAGGGVEGRRKPGSVVCSARGGAIISLRMLWIFHRVYYALFLPGCIGEIVESESMLCESSDSSRDF